MNELVQIKDNDIFTNSLVIAEGTNNQHHSITRIIRNYESDFKDFGKIRFMDLKSNNPQGGRPTRIYDLNEPQATLLITYLDNTAEVRTFKKNLVKEFYRMRQYILQRSTAEWQQARCRSKLTRNAETDVLKEFIEYARQQGSRSADKYYIHFTNIVNGAVGLDTGMRDKVSSKVLAVVEILEDMILHTVDEQIKAGTHYKEIYRICKTRTNEMMHFIYLPEQKLLA